MSVIKLAILHVINSVQGLVQMVAKVLVLEAAQEVVLGLLKETVTLARVYVQRLAKMGVREHALQVALAVVKVVANLDALAVVKAVVIQDVTIHAKVDVKDHVNPHALVLAVVDVQVVVEVLAGDSFGLTL